MGASFSYGYPGMLMVIGVLVPFLVWCAMEHKLLPNRFWFESGTLCVERDGASVARFDRWTATRSLGLGTLHALHPQTLQSALRLPLCGYAKGERVVEAAAGGT